jgi:2'-5' RNA ligase
LKRLFTAIPVIGEIQKDFLSIAERNALAGVRWTKPDNLHITLFFIGEVEDESVDKVAEQLKRDFSSIQRFELNFLQIETKYKKGKPAMIWARFEKSDEFSDLSKRIEHSVKRFMTIEPQHKDPIPHCTLARTKPFAEVEKVDFKLNKNFQIVVDKVELWMTRPEKDGVVYERVWT